MRHRKAGAKLGRTTSHRTAMTRNMLTSLFEHEKIVTTEAKAKAVKPMADKMITLAKRGDLHARRQALSFLTSKSTTAKLFSELKDRYMERSGGYTSVVKLGVRHGDGAPLAILELIKPEDAAKAKKKVRKKKTAKKKTAETAPKQAKKSAVPAKAAKETPKAEPVVETVAVEPAAKQEPSVQSESQTDGATVASSEPAVDVPTTEGETKTE
jgi:large subunit ribosomal protein L17